MGDKIKVEVKINKQKINKKREVSLTFLYEVVRFSRILSTCHHTMVILQSFIKDD